MCSQRPPAPRARVTNFPNCRHCFARFVPLAIGSVTDPNKYNDRDSMPTIPDKTKVIFRLFKRECLALFPQLAGTLDPSTCLSYAHVGQHGSADFQRVRDSSRLATPAEFKTLAKELRSIGYKLDIRTRLTRADYLERVRQTDRKNS